MTVRNKVRVANPHGETKKMPAKKKPAKKKPPRKNPSRRRAAAEKKPGPKRRRRPAKKNPEMHPALAAGLGMVFGAGAGVAASAGLRYFGVGSNTSRGAGLLVAAPLLGIPTAFLSRSFGAGLGAGLGAAGGGELTSGMQPRAAASEVVDTTGAVISERDRAASMPARQPVAALHGATRVGAVVADDQTGAVVADDQTGAVVADDQTGAATRVGMIVGADGSMYVDERLARRMRGGPR